MSDRIRFGAGQEDTGKHTGAKILNLSKNSHFENLTFHKIHISKILFFTKFTLQKSHFSQNSHFSKSNSRVFLDKKRAIAPVCNGSYGTK